MGQKTKIQWSDATWSPIRARVKPDAAAIARVKGYTSLVQIAGAMAGHVGPHCEHVSPGCENCYSDTNNHRCLPSNGTGLPFDRRSRDLVDIFVDEKILLQPLKWNNSKRIFPANQTDWCAEFVPEEMMDRMLAVAALTPWHTYQFLTKRADRLANYTDDRLRDHYQARVVYWMAQTGDGKEFDGIPDFPLPNIQLGFSAEDQPNFDARWEHMRRLAAAGWFVWCSYEPALGPVDFRRALSEGLRWIVIGGESGRGARPFNLEWAWRAIEQGREAEVPVFVKQCGARPYIENGLWRPYIGNGLWSFGGGLKFKDRKGGDPAEWPEWARVREFPEGAI